MSATRRTRHYVHSTRTFETAATSAAENFRGHLTHLGFDFGEENVPIDKGWIWSVRLPDGTRCEVQLNFRQGDLFAQGKVHSADRAITDVTIGDGWIFGDHVWGISEKGLAAGASARLRRILDRALELTQEPALSAA